MGWHPPYGSLITAAQKDKMMTYDLGGKVAAVTGAASGIGLECARYTNGINF